MKNICLARFVRLVFVGVRSNARGHPEQTLDFYPQWAITRVLFFGRIHSDDREATPQTVDRALAERMTYDTKYRVVWLDDSVHWLAARGRGY